MVAKKDKEALDMVMDRLSLADDGRTDVVLNAVENEKLYHNYIDETENPFISNISLPWPYIVTESYLGKCIQVMAAVMPYVHVVEEDDDSRPKARAVEKDANMVLYKQKWPVLSYNMYKQAFKYGTAWLLEKPWGVLDGSEMPLFSLANFFHVWVNPTILTLDDPDAYVIYETFVPKWYLKQMYTGNPNYKNLSKIETYTGERFTEEEQEIRAFKAQDSLSEDKYSDLVQILYYWSWNDFIVISNSDNVIRNDGENFLGKIPLRPIQPLPLDNEFYGMSILEEGKQLFAEANENRNQFNDAAWLMLNPQYIVNSETAGLKVKTIRARSGNIIWTEDVNAIVPLKNDWNLLNMCLLRQKAIYEDIQNCTNAFPQLRGAPVTGAETATEYLGMRSAGELRSDTYNLLLAMQGIETIVKDIVDYKKMFMIDQSSSYYWPEGKTNTATPEDYNGNFAYKSFSSFKHAKEIERKQFIEAMTLVWGNQAFMPFIVPKTEEWLERLLDYFDLRSPEQLRLTEMERMQAQGMAQLQGMMQLLGGGGTTAGGAPKPATGENEMRAPETSPNTFMAQMAGR